MPHTIIVPLDGSEWAERALGPASALADRSGAEVVVLTAVQGGVVVDPKHYLSEVAEAAGITSARVVVVDDRLAASAIVLVASDAPDPVVCMATHARGASGHALFGSVAEETLRRTPAPLLLAGPHMPSGHPALDHLVVCLDGSDLSVAILPTVRSWAQALGADVTLVTVHDAGESGDSERENLDRVAGDLEAECGPVTCTVLSARKAADAIVDFAGQRPGSVITLTSHGRTGMARLTAGSVTMAVVRTAPCPVLTMRPLGLAAS